jgi:hypothetical protein
MATFHMAAADGTDTHWGSTLSSRMAHRYPAHLFAHNAVENRFDNVLGRNPSYTFVRMYWGKS